MVNIEITHLNTAKKNKIIDSIKSGKFVFKKKIAQKSKDCPLQVLPTFVAENNGATVVKQENDGGCRSYKEYQSS